MAAKREAEGDRGLIHKMLDRRAVGVGFDRIESFEIGIEVV